jgi:uncharacterized lipoprotein YbaY
MYGWGSRTRTYEWRDQNPLPYQLGYTPSDNHAAKAQLLGKNGWGSRTRTYEWRDQNPLPYQLGYTPTVVRKERLELSRREALEPKSSVSTNSTTPAQSEPREKLDKKKNWWLWRDSNLRPHHYE